MSLRSKIIHTEAELTKFITEHEGKRIVFTNGCFDLIHPGHVLYLEKAAEMGDLLFVGLNSDASVKNLKGESRPVQNEEARMLVLAALESVSAVCLFQEDTPLKLIEKVKPTLLVKGGDYKPMEIVGYDFVRSLGGEVKTIPFVEGHSSSAIIERI